MIDYTSGLEVSLLTGYGRCCSKQELRALVALLLLGRFCFVSLHHFIQSLSGV